MYKDNDGDSYNGEKISFNRESLSGDMSLEYSYLYEGSYVDDLICVFSGQTVDWQMDDHTIILAIPQTVSAEFYEWAITGGNLVKQEGETWVLNEDIDLENDLTATIAFSSGEYNDWFELAVYTKKGGGLAYARYGASGARESTVAYDNMEFSGWSNQAYRTITFSTPPTGDLLIWLQANGTKQGG